MSFTGEFIFAPLRPSKVVIPRNRLRKLFTPDYNPLHQLNIQLNRTSLGSLIDKRTTIIPTGHGHHSNQNNTLNNTNNTGHGNNTNRQKESSNNDTGSIVSNSNGATDNLLKVSPTFLSET